MSHTIKGELEFGDFPLRHSFPFNYLVFALFVFLVVIVMMNLLTGMALMDVQAVANQSTGASQPPANTPRTISIGMAAPRTTLPERIKRKSRVSMWPPWIERISGLPRALRGI